MKTIDLSGDTFRQTIVDKESSEYLGHVSAILLNDGKTIFAAYPRSHGRGTVILKRSNDGGLNWSERLNVSQSWHTSLQVPTLFTTNEAGGKQNLLMVTGLYPIRQSISKDNGQTWSELQPVGDFGGNVSFSDMIRLKSGAYMAFFHDDGRYIKRGNDSKLVVKESVSDKGERKIDIYKQHHDSSGNWGDLTLKIQCNASFDNSVNWVTKEVIYESHAANKSNEYLSKIYSTVSTDGGMTWENPVEILSHSTAFLAEAAAIRSPDKNQIAMIMRENTRQFNSLVSLSDDEGKTWSKPTAVANELTGDRHCLKYLSDGRIVACFRDVHKDSPYYGDWVAWIGTYDDMINNRQGQYKIRLKSNHSERFGDCGYSGLLVLPDDTIVAITYGSWTIGEKPYIISVRFRADEFGD